MLTHPFKDEMRLVALEAAGGLPNIEIDEGGCTIVAVHVDLDTETSASYSRV